MHRECESKSVIVVTHGEFMSAARAALEYLSDEQWVLNDEDRAHKIFNTHVYHYSRRDPKNGSVGKYVAWRRSICPHKDDSDSGWLPVKRRRFTNQELLDQVSEVRSLLR